MKKILLLMIPALMLGFTGCKKDKKDDGGEKTEVYKPVQNVSMFYVSGTWCGPCGMYGKPTLQKAHNKTKRINVISAQINGAGGAKDPFNNQYANQIAGVFNVSGVPSLFIADGKGGIGSATGGASMWTNTEKFMDDVLKNTTPEVYAKPKVKLDGNNIKVDIDAEFFADYGNQYRFAVYITESRLESIQFQDARTEDKNMHDDILRLCLNTDIVGDIVTDSVKKGDKISKSYSGTLDESWNKKNLKAVVVFWRHTDDKTVTYVNSESTNVK